MPKYAILDDPEIGPAIIREIAEDVLIQACADLKSRSLAKQLSAAMFLSGPGLPYWLAAAINEDPTEIKEAGILALTSGRLKEDKRILVKNG